MRRIISATLLTASSLALAAAPASAGGGCHDAPTEGDGDTVEMTGMCFTPTVLHVDPGTEVAFVNRDPMTHVVVGVGWGDWQELGTGDAVTHRFDDAGSFPYTCNLHPGMNGVVVVDDAEPISATTEESSGAPSALVPAVAGVAVVGAYLLGRQRALASVPR